MIRFLLFFFILFLSSFPGLSQNYKQVEIRLSDISDIQKLYSAGMDFDHPYLTKDNSVIVFVDENDFEILEGSNFDFDVLVDDWGEYYQNLPILSEEERQRAIIKTKSDFNVSGFEFGSMGGFYTLDEVIAELDSMKILFPGLITEKQEIGLSIQSRPIYMVKISNNPSVNEEEPEILYTALHHAREPQGMMQMIYFMYYLLENYGIDPEVTYLVDNRQIYFIPVLNPDGYEYNHQINPNGGGMWRKNRRNNGNGIYGVDLNRNYGPYEYWNASNGGSSTDPGSSTYRGTAPFSEPETAAIRNFLAERKIKNTLNYHTHGNLLIFPYGALEQETADSLIFRKYAGDMTAYNGYVYGTDQQTVGYSTRGNSDDYFYDGDTVLNSGKIFAMTPEVGNYLDGFWPQQSRIIPLAEENLYPNLYYAWVAGGYVEVENPNFSKQYFNPGDAVLMNTEFRNIGLSDISTVEVQLNSLSSYVNIVNGNGSISSIPSFGTVEIDPPFSFEVVSNAQAEEVELEFVISALGSEMGRDTIRIIIGTPEFVFVDTTDNPNELWTITATPSDPKWEATTSVFYSSPASYTDSKIGNYSNNANVTMTMTNSIDLSEFQNPRLTFWSKWDIEGNWDYGQVEASTDNGNNWNPLEGDYTESGEGSFQPNGEPLYDGVQSSWVREEISLADFTSSEFKIRFKLVTDGYVTRDGWYVDDIGIVVYTIVPVELVSFSAEPSEDKVILRWITATELNNQGFEIQRLGNIESNNWLTIGHVKGAGTTSDKRDYIFTDKSPLNGTTYYRLKQIDFDGSFRIYNELKVEFKTVKEYSLDQNFPNPFNPTTTITYSLPVAEHVSLTVYNLLGSEVAKLIDGVKQAGTHSLHFSTEELGENIGSGIYFYTLKAGDFTQTRKMIVVK